MRELTARTLHNLAPCAPAFMLEHALPQLLEQATGRDLHLSHGATLAAGHLLAGLSGVAEARNQGLEELLGQSLMTGLEEVVGKMVELHKLRGLGGEMMRQAVSDFILRCCSSRLPLKGRPVLHSWLQVIVLLLSLDFVTSGAGGKPVLPRSHSPAVGSARPPCPAPAPADDGG